MASEFCWLSHDTTLTNMEHLSGPRSWAWCPSSRSWCTCRCSRCQCWWSRPNVSVTTNNKSAQSNLGRGPRHGTVAHICRKVPIGYNGAPQIRPQKYPFPWTDPQTPLPASSLDPSDLRCQKVSGSDLPFCHNALDRQTDRGTYICTDRQIVHGKVWWL